MNHPRTGSSTFSSLVASGTILAVGLLFFPSLVPADDVAKPAAADPTPSKAAGKSEVTTLVSGPAASPAVKTSTDQPTLAPPRPKTPKSADAGTTPKMAAVPSKPADSKTAEPATPAVSSTPAAKPAAETAKPAEPKKKYILHYKFQPGETLRWEVAHRAQIRTTVADTTQTAETTSISIKTWKVTSVDKFGNATFEHLVESVDMKQKLTGRQEVTYNSLSDKTPPNGFQDVAKAVGVTLSVITMDTTGKIVRRVEKHVHAPSDSTHMTVALPGDAVAIGDRWQVPYEVKANTRAGTVQVVKLRQQLTLEAVIGDMATIDVETQVLSPLQDPAVEAQLVQSELSGKVRFDMQAGRVISLKNDCDKHVVGFQGDASSMHYVTQVQEKLLGSTSETPKVAGPEAPKPLAKTAPTTPGARTSPKATLIPPAVARPPRTNSPPPTAARPAPRPGQSSPNAARKSTGTQSMPRR